MAPEDVRVVDVHLTEAPEARLERLEAAMAEQARAAAEKQHEPALKSQLEIARASAASQLIHAEAESDNLRGRRFIERA